MNTQTNTEQKKQKVFHPNPKPKYGSLNNFKKDVNKEKAAFKLKVYFNREFSLLEGKTGITFFSYNTKNNQMAWNKLINQKNKWLSKSNVCIIYNNHTNEKIEAFYPEKNINI